MTPRRTAAAAAVVVAVALLAWWAWPTWTVDDRPDLLVLDDGALAGGRRSLELRAREDGRTVRWAALDEAWCDDPAALAHAVDEVDPEWVVVSTAPRCVDAIGGAVDDRRVLVVVPPGSATGDDARVDVVDPVSLVGRPGDVPRLVCVWWEPCDGDGRIAVREPTGELTSAGHERVARMIVAAL